MILKQNTCCTRRSPIPAAEGSSWRGTKCADLETRPTTVRTTAFPSDRGSPETKSKAMWDQGRGGVAKGCRRPAGAWWEDFPVGTHRRGSNEPPCVSGHGRPPEPLAQQMEGTGLPRLARRARRVGPLQGLSLLQAEPDQAPWVKTRPPGARLQAQTPILAPGWGPDCATPGIVKVHVRFASIGVFGLLLVWPRGSFGNSN